MSDLSALEARIQILEDIEAIKKLKAKYFRCCDLRLPDEMADCLMDNVRVDYDKIGVFEDRKSFIAVFVELGCRDNIIDLHHGHNPEIEIHGDESASGFWELYFYTVDTDAKTARQLGGYYQDEYCKLNGEWRIRSTKFTSLSVQDYRLGEEGGMKTSFDAEVEE